MSPAAQSSMGGETWGCGLPPSIGEPGGALAQGAEAHQGTTKACLAPKPMPKPWVLVVQVHAQVSDTRRARYSRARPTRGSLSTSGVCAGGESRVVHDDGAAGRAETQLVRRASRCRGGHVVYVIESEYPTSINTGYKHGVAVVLREKLLSTKKQKSSFCAARQVSLGTVTRTQR